MSSPSPRSILIVGATGNTGVGVVKTLVLHLASSLFAQHKIIALTRDASSLISRELDALSDNVQVVEKNWTSIDADWLMEHSVQRLFIASHNGVTHFVDESLFLNYALEAGVEYAVRISTTRASVGAATSIWYGRSHWAIETMLADPAFASMKWTSLQPNIFHAYCSPALTQWLETYRKTGHKGTLKIAFDGDAPMAPIDGTEVGNIAGLLLLNPDASTHTGKRYILTGPSDITGKESVQLLEKHAGVKVDHVVWRDNSMIHAMKGPMYPDNTIASLARNLNIGYEGQLSIKRSSTSPEVLQFYQPKVGAYEAYDQALDAVPK
jgi:uncharacterized protein YbjT (DUF2867 family)